jgi:PAS domain S-box-containing protein
MFGFESPYDLIGKGVIEFTPEGYRSTISDYIKETYKDIGRMDSLESKILNINGETIDVSVSRTIFDYKGRPASLCILWDISAKNQIEDLKKDIQESKRLLDESLEFNRLIKEFFANFPYTRWISIR